MSNQNDVTPTDGTGKTYKSQSHLRLVRDGESWSRSSNSHSTGGGFDGGGHGGGSEGGGDMRDRIIRLEAQIPHINNNVNEIKNGLGSINTDIKSIHKDLNNRAIQLILAGLAAMYALYSLIDISSDKKLENIDQKITIQFSNIVEQIRDLKSTNNNSQNSNIISQDTKKDK